MEGGEEKEIEGRIARGRERTSREEIRGEEIRGEEKRREGEGRGHLLHQISSMRYVSVLVVIGTILPFSISGLVQSSLKSASTLQLQRLTLDTHTHTTHTHTHTVTYTYM